MNEQILFNIILTESLIIFYFVSDKLVSFFSKNKIQVVPRIEEINEKEGGSTR